MRLTFYTYSYIDRLRLEPSEVLPLVAQAGYDGIDLSATWRSDDDPGCYPAERRWEIRRLCDELGLTLEALVTHLPLVDSLREGLPLNLVGAVDLAVELRCPLVTVHVGQRRDGCAPGEPGPDWSRAVAHLEEVAEYGQEHGVRLATDATYPTYMTADPEDVLRLLTDVDHPNLGHNFDPCYLEATGYRASSAIQLLGPRILHAHIKDYVGRYPAFEHRIPGQGVLHHGSWAHALQAGGFDGAVAVECFTDMPLQDALEVGYRTVSRALDGVGARPLPAP